MIMKSFLNAFSRVKQGGNSASVETVINQNTPLKLLNEDPFLIVYFALITKGTIFGEIIAILNKYIFNILIKIVILFLAIHACNPL